MHCNRRSKLANVNDRLAVCEDWRR